MRARGIIAALCALLLLLGGCALPDRAELPMWVNGIIDRFSPEETAAVEGETLTVYRLRAPGALERGMTDGELLGQEVCPIPPEAASPVDAAVTLFAAPSADPDLIAPLPEGVTVEDWTVENTLCTLTLSEGFLDLGEVDRAAAAFCAALTLCQLEEVDAVTVTAGGRVLYSGLVPEDALLRDTDTDPYVRQLRLYFADSQGRYLVSEYHSLTLDEEAAPDRYVMEELLRGPNSGELQSALPAGTEVLSCSTADGVCTVDLSREFYVNRPDTAVGERLAIYSIVNSLTVLSQVDSVAILVEGEPLERYVYRPLAQPLGRYEEAVGPVSAAMGEADADIYLPLPGLAAIAPLPWRIDLGEYESSAEAVMAALLGAAEPGYPALFSGSGTVMGVSLHGSTCTVDLSESFFASLPAEARNAAVQSMAASLCALDEIDRVSFTIAGGQALFDGADWSGPWEDFDLIAG